MWGEVGGEAAAPLASVGGGGEAAAALASVPRGGSGRRASEPLTAPLVADAPTAAWPSDLSA
ncbi:MAG: pectate lyase, partial [Chloroflexi bacterium]